MQTQLSQAPESSDLEHFLQVPGPTFVPERILAAMHRQMLDHRGPEFQTLTRQVLEGLPQLFRSTDPVILFPSSGTGGWEAALVNTLSPGDTVLFLVAGHFSMLWSRMAAEFGLDVRVLESSWHRGADAAELEVYLRSDIDRKIKAVCVVHNETSTGARTQISDIRAAMDATSHPALLLVDAVSSIGAMDYRHQEWNVDVTISGSQKGLMLPPGMSFNVVSERALEATTHAKLPRSYWSWNAMLAQNADGFFPFTPPISLVYGLAESMIMLNEWGLDNVFARHKRHAEAVRRCVAYWDLEIWCKIPRDYSPAVTAIVMPAGHDADAFRKLARDRFNISLGMGQQKLAGKAFRFGHLGYTNDNLILAGLEAVEAALEHARIPHRPGGVDVAGSYLNRRR